jgi:hypothetical protein
VLGPVDGNFGQVEADDPVIGRGCFDAELLEDAGGEPLGSAAPQCCFTGAADASCDVPRAAGDEASEDPFEADAIRDPAAVTAQRMRSRTVHRDERFDGCPHGINGPRVKREHDG